MNEPKKEGNGCVLLFMATCAALTWLLYVAMDVIDTFLGIK